MALRRTFAIAFGLAAALFLALLLSGPSPSQAAFPGKNGKRIIFERGSFLSFPIHSAIFSVPAKGGNPHALTTRATGTDGDPSVSPNGRKVLFDSDRLGGTEQIFKMKPSGKHQRALTKGTDPSFGPAWSPDGKHIAFAGRRNGKSGIFTMKASGKHVRRVTSLGPDSFSVRWSLDGKWLAFESDNDGDFDVYRIRTNGKHLKQVTDNPGFDGDPEFSPDGKKLLFDSSLTGGGDIYRMNLDGSHLKRITKNPANENAAAYSPNGRSIVFSRGNDLWVATRKGKNPHELTVSPSSDFGAVWGPRP
jgi:TolB protein